MAGTLAEHWDYHIENFYGIFFMLEKIYLEFFKILERFWLEIF